MEIMPSSLAPVPSATSPGSSCDLVIVTTSFPLAGDGKEAAGSFVSDLVEELGKQAVVRVVAPGLNYERQIWSSGVEVFRYPAPARPLSTLKLWRPADIGEIGKVIWAGNKATKFACGDGSVKHIIALWSLPSGYWALRAFRRIGVSYSVWALGSDIWSLGKIPIVRRQLRIVLESAYRCFADGIKLAEDAGRVGKRKVEFLPSTRKVAGKGLHSAAAGPPYQLLFLGRWHPNKGIDLLIDALELLSVGDWRRIKEVQIFGGGPLASTVQDGVHRLQKRGCPVVIGGYLNKAAAVDSILRSDYVLIPSRIESIPVLFSDAVKLGVPVISMPVGDLPALVGRFFCGELAAEISAPAFARAIGQALRRDARQYAPGVEQCARMFDLSRIASRLAQLARTKRAY